LYLVLLQPFLQELLPTLLKDWARKFNRLEMIELPLLKEDTEVLQDGRQTTRRCWGCLERLDDLYGVQNSLAKMI
jgi:hypothetical protein